MSIDRRVGAGGRIRGRLADDDAPGGSGRSRGQSVVEFAIVTPILLLILVSTAQFGTILATQIGITNAVREAAREASVVPTTTADAAGVNGQWASDRLRAVLLPDAPNFDATRLVLTGSGPTEVCYRAATDVTGGAEVLVRVQATYRHALWLPIVSELLDPIDGVTDGALRLSVDEEILVENVATPALADPVCVT